MNDELSTTKLEANRKNSRRSTGPKDATSVRFNAVKHGLLAEGVTELDDPETFPALCGKLEAELKPQGEDESFLVRQIALGMVRLKRAARLEAEYTTAELNPPITDRTGSTYGTVVYDPGLPARLTSGAVETLVTKFGRYETQIENRLFRHLHELERLQRLRSGENIPAPASVEVAVHGEKALVDKSRNFES